MSNEIQEEIRVEDIKEEDSENVLILLREYFFKDEPINNCLKIGDSVEMEKGVTNSILEKCSFKAVNLRGEIVGVVINNICKKPKQDEPLHSFAAECQHPQFKKVLTLLEYVHDRFSAFDMYPEQDRLLDVNILSVNSNYRGYGIAGKLMEHTMNYMRENRFTVIQVVCTSHFSARVCQKMGFKTVYSLPYVDYVVNGENPILPADPHKAVQILVQEIL